MKVDWKRSRGHAWPAVREEEVDGIWFAEIRVKLGLTEKRVWLVCVDIIVTKGGFQWTVGHRFFNCGFRSSRAKLLFLIQGYWCPRELCTVRASQGAIADHSQRWKITPKILFLVLTNVSSIFVLHISSELVPWRMKNNIKLSIGASLVIINVVNVFSPKNRRLLWALGMHKMAACNIPSNIFFGKRNILFCQTAKWKVSIGV